MERIEQQDFDFFRDKYQIMNMEINRGGDLYNPEEPEVRLTMSASGFRELLMDMVVRRTPEIHMSFDEFIG